MKRFVLAALLLVMLVACSSGKAGPSESSLRSQMMTTWSALQKGDYAKLYTFVSEDVRSHCSQEQFTAQTRLIKGGLGDTFLGARLYIDKVAITGEAGYYESTYSLNGAILSTSARYVHWEKDHWVPDQDSSATPNPDYPCNPY